MNKRLKLVPLTVEAALLNVKEVQLGTILPNKLWERSSRALAFEVQRLREEVTRLQDLVYDYDSDH